MVAKQPSIPTKFSALQYRGIEFDTKPCSVVSIMERDTSLKGAQKPRRTSQEFTKRKL
jgi:hypothetical protein